MQTTANVIDKNWKALIKPNKLDITSNEDKTIAKVVAEPLEKGFGQTISLWSSASFKHQQVHNQFFSFSFYSLNIL